MRVVSNEKNEILRKISDLVEKGKKKRTPHGRGQPPDPGIIIGDINGSQVTIKINYTLQCHDACAWDAAELDDPLAGTNDARECDAACADSPVVRQVLATLGDELVIGPGRKPITRLPKRAPKLITVDQNASFPAKAPADAAPPSNAPQPRRTPRVLGAPGWVNSMKGSCQSDHLPTYDRKWR
ncbi:MAG: hypothetical protein E6Q98_18155 [Rhodospirillaceae bacterium]|nr:MAG: hypothetical protein E6Q98_18155 [Rhodospirillaceae bacterium]